MKKKVLTLLSFVMAVVMLMGCGADKAEEEVLLKDLDVEQYVTLGEYKGIEVALDPIQVDESDWKYMTDQLYYSAISNSGIEIEGIITDRPVEVGDTVNIDYMGMKDGVAFGGGTAEGAYLTIGSGQFIDGFEDGLVGVMPGDTVDLNLTFPSYYDNAELAGQDVVFTVTVNHIMPEEMNQEVIAFIGLEGVSTGEDLSQYVYDYLYSYEEQNYNSMLQSAVLQTFMNNCTFGEIPESMNARYEDIVRANMEAQASAYGMNVDALVGYNYGMTLDDFIATYVPETVKQDLAFQAVANRENLNVSDEELNETLLEYANNAGYDTIEEYVGETPLEDYREYFMYSRVLEFLIDNAKVIN